MWNRWRSNHRFAESGLQRPCCIEHLVTASGRIEPGEGSGAGRAEKDRVEGLAVDSVKARAGIDAPQYGNCHRGLGCTACNERKKLSYCLWTGPAHQDFKQIGRASCRERVCQSV